MAPKLSSASFGQRAPAQASIDAKADRAVLKQVCLVTIPHPRTTKKRLSAKTSPPPMPRLRSPAEFDHAGTERAVRIRRRAPCMTTQGAVWDDGRVRGLRNKQWPEHSAVLSLKPPRSPPTVTLFDRAMVFWCCEKKSGRCSPWHQRSHACANVTPGVGRGVPCHRAPAATVFFADPGMGHVRIRT